MRWRWGRPSIEHTWPNTDRLHPNCRCDALTHCRAPHLAPGCSSCARCHRWYRDTGRAGRHGSVLALRAHGIIAARQQTAMLPPTPTIRGTISWRRRAPSGRVRRWPGGNWPRPERSKSRRARRRLRSGGGRIGRAPAASSARSRERASGSRPLGVGDIVECTRPQNRWSVATAAATGLRARPQQRGLGRRHQRRDRARRGRGPRLAARVFAPTVADGELSWEGAGKELN